MKRPESELHQENSRQVDSRRARLRKLKKQGECEMNRMKVELEALVARVKAQGEQVAVPSFGVENSQVYQAQAHDEPEAKGGSRRSNRTGNEPQQLKRSVLYKKVVLDSKMY